MDDGCHKETDYLKDDVIGFYQDDGLYAFVQCCVDSNAGTECKTMSDCTDSTELVTYSDANSTCTDLGYRLCTKEELLEDPQICCGKGGGCDSYPVWTSTPVTESK